MTEPAEKTRLALPQHAKERIANTRTAHGAPFFTSDLSVNEFLLVRSCGFEPAGLVMGSSIYHVGAQGAVWTQSTEMVQLTQALYQARELAMSRMIEEADELGADGVVGVRLRVNRHAWGSDMLEFFAVGTAIRSRDGQSWRAPSGEPFTSDLSGQDFWTLLRSGYRPVSLVMGNCVYHVAAQQQQTPAQANQELTVYTQGLYDARELAMERLQYEAQVDGATGVVGTEITETTHSGWDARVIEFFAVGTSVLPISLDHEPPEPQLVIHANS
jgi:uncharacterized protein YbjQ (UPF0145 family)